LRKRRKEYLAWFNELSALSPQFPISSSVTSFFLGGQHMDLMLLRLFQRQVALQCKFLLSSAAQANKALEDRNVEGVFFALQNLLNAGANVSKALWGGGGKLAAQRKPLRDSIGITDTSPLREVAIRNNFEHFDERLDRWWNESKKHNHSDMNIASKGMISGIDEIDRFRIFDPQTKDLTFWGQEFNLQALVTEAQAILPKLEAEANKPHWDPAAPRPLVARNGKLPDGATQE
jgi:hypothetical protein